MKKVILWVMTAVAIFALTACNGNNGDAQGDTGDAGDSTALTVNAEGEAAVGLTYTPLGEGAVLVEVDCGDGDGDCSVDVNQQIAMGDAALDAHFLGDGHTDDAVCPFAADNLEQQEILGQ